MLPDKQEVLNELNRVRAETEAALQNLDPNAVIYAESEWTIKDIIGHLTTWEEEYLATLQAYLKNSSYVMELKKMSEDDYNERNVARRKNFTNERIWRDWRDTRTWLLDLLNQLNIDKIKGDITAPWGKKMPFLDFMHEVVQHEIDHRADILKKVGK